MNTSKIIRLGCVAVSLLSLRFAVSYARNVDRDSGGFRCGPALICNPARQYCSVLHGGPVGTPPGYACVDVPGANRPACGSISAIGCECVEASGGVTLTCTAP